MTSAQSDSVIVPVVNGSNGTLEDEFINGLVQGGSWVFDGPRQISYSFNLNDDGSYPEGPIGPGPGGSWSSYPQIATAVTQALTAWSNVADISFQEVTSGTYYFQSTADLAFTLTGDDLQYAFGAVGLSFFPDPDYVNTTLAEGGYNSSQFPNMEGNVFLDNWGMSPLVYSVETGSSGYWVILHEIGHALGLKHTFDDGGNLKPTFTELGIGEYDAMQHTVMTYTTGFGYAATPMPLDILAIQAIYGANTAYNTGDNSYTLNNGYYSTIWDAGGTDTIDATSWPGAEGVLLDLNSGAFSGTRIGEKTTAIAYGVTIENATGTGGPDHLLGNGHANVLSGAAGNDTLDGGGGADSLIGGQGDDLFYVDDAGDVVSEADGEGVDLVQSAVSYALGANIENLTLAGFAPVNGTGNTLSNVLIGNAADNVLDGGAGSDALMGGAGNDKYVVDDAGDAVFEPRLNFRASADSSGAQGSSNSDYSALSADGRYVAFRSYSSNLVEGDTNNDFDIFVKDLLTGMVTRASTATGGVQVGFVDGLDPAISADGRYVAFSSQANDLVAGDTNNSRDIFLKDLQTGVLTRVSTNASGIEGNSLSQSPAISADGRYVAFQSYASNLVAGDTGWADIFVKDLQTGAVTLVSITLGGVQGNGNSFNPSISADGRYVAFESFADNLVAGDSNFSKDVFVKDLQTGVLTLVSTSTSGTQGNFESVAPAISADGRYVAFSSYANNLVAEDTNTGADIFVKDLQAGTLTRVSTAADGAQSVYAFGGDSVAPAAISSDGRYVAFGSYAENLVSGDTNGQSDIFLKDVLTGAISRMSAAADGTQANGSSFEAAISADGQRVAFNSTASNLVGDDTNGLTDVFVASNTSGGDFGGIDEVVSSATYVLGANVEILRLSGNAGIGGTGNALQNILSGNAGDNVLDGAAGADIIAGGPGNDTYVVDNSGDQVMELGNSGLDDVQSAVSYDLMQAWHVENLTLTGGGAVNGSGNWLDNVIIGNNAANVLSGNRGNDTINGGGGSDTLAGGLGDDVLVWDAADASVQGGAGSDTLLIDGGGVTLNLKAIADTLITDIEAIDLTGSGDNTLTLALADVLAISSTSDVLRVDGNSGDVVNAGAGWTSAGIQLIGGQDYAAYTESMAMLLIDANIVVNFA